MTRHTSSPYVFREDRKVVFSIIPCLMADLIGKMREWRCGHKKYHEVRGNIINEFPQRKSFGFERFNELPRPNLKKGFAVFHLYICFANCCGYANAYAFGLVLI